MVKKMTRTKNKKQDYAAPKTGNFAEIGVTGLSSFSGQIQEDFLRELRGVEGYKRYNEMRLNSPVIGGMLLAIEQSIRRISWSFASDLGVEDERLEFLKNSLENMSLSWNDHIIEALTMLPFGFSLFEIVYKRNENGRIVWRKLAIRGQDTIWQWLLDDAGGLQGVKQQLTTTYEIKEIPIEKLLLYRARVERNNPEGRSILRTAWIPYYFAKHIQQIEAIGIERDLAGLPVMTLPDGADTSDTTTSDLGIAKKIVRNIRNDEQAGVVKPFGWELELLSTGGSRQFDTSEIVKRYESRILMSALAQFLILGQDKVGTQALSTDMTDFFTMAVNATADIISETFTKYAIPRLLALNGYDTKGITLEHTPAGDTDTNAVATLFSSVGAHITLDADDENRLRKLLGLRERDIEELQAERDLKEQRKEETRQAFVNRTNDNDDMGAEFYEVDLPPDDRKRNRQEREWERVLSEEYFPGALARIKREARKMR